MKTRKHILIILCFLVLAVILAACQGSMAEYEPVDARFSANPAVESGDVGTSFLSSIPPTTERLVIMNADLTIEVEDPADSIDFISQLAQNYRGFVVSSDLRQVIGARGTVVPYATITIRVPAEQLIRALEEIEVQAIEVQSKSQSGQDVTKEYTDMQSRLRNLEDTAKQLRQIMEEARNTDAVLDVYRELTNVTEEIEVIRGQIQYFDESIAFSAISVTLITHEEIKPISIGGWQPVGVARDAVQALVDTLQVIANIIIWLVIYVAPVLAVLSLTYMAIRWAYRKWLKPKPKKKKSDE